MKMLSRKSLFVFSAAITVVAFAFYLLVSEAQKLREDTCTGVTRIASDAQKMKYVKSWIASRTNDRKFMGEIGRIRFFEAGDPRLREFIDLDWDYLEFTPESVSLAFNVRNAGNGDFDASNIGSVSIGQNRSMIFIGLNKRKDLGLLWPAEELSRIRPIADEIFVYCGS